MSNLNDEWPNNSVSGLSITDLSFQYLMYITVALSGLILIHSAVINFKKKRNIVAVTTNLATISLLIEAILFLYCSYPDKCSSTTMNATLLAFFANGCCGALIQAADNYITFSRYVCVVGGQVSSRHTIMAIVYVIVFLYATWWPWYTFVPFWRNMNTDDSINLIDITNIYINFPAYILYDLFYTSKLILFIRKLNSESTLTRANTSAMLMAKKALAHNLLSIAGAWFFAFYLPQGVIIQSILIVLALHFLFNWKGSKYIFNPSELYRNKYAVDSTGTPGPRGSTITVSRIRVRRSTMMRQPTLIRQLTIIKQSTNNNCN